MKAPMITTQERSAVPSGYPVSQFPVPWKSSQRSDVSCFWDSLALKTSQVDIILPAPVFRLCMCLAILMNANGLIFDHRKTSLALLFASGWSEHKTRKEDLHSPAFALLPWTKSCSQKSAACLVTDFSEKNYCRKVNIYSSVSNVYPELINLIYWPLYE